MSCICVNPECSNVAYLANALLSFVCANVTRRNSLIGIDIILDRLEADGVLDEDIIHFLAVYVRRRCRPVPRLSLNSVKVIGETVPICESVIRKVLTWLACQQVGVRWYVDDFVLF